MKRLSISLFFIMLFFNAWSQEQMECIAYENLVFEGAGLKGLAYAGVIKQLESYQIIDGIEKVGGTSAGAITALTVALCYNSQEIYDIVSSMKLQKFNHGGFWVFGGLHRINKRFGWYKSKKFERWLEKIIKNKTGDSEVTFQELVELGYKGLYVTGTCLNRQELITFSAETYPNMKIKDAVKASMSIPLYFEATFIDKEGKTYRNLDDKKNLDVIVDGGLLGNFPIRIFDEVVTNKEGETVRIPNEKTLGIRMDTDEQIESDQAQKGLVSLEINDFKSYFSAFFVITVENLNRCNLTPADWDRTLSVSSMDVNPKIRKMKQETKDILMESGEQSVIEYFEDR